MGDNDAPNHTHTCQKKEGEITRRGTPHSRVSSLPSSRDPGQPTRSCNREIRDARYMLHGALGPRFRGDDNGGGGDDGLQMKIPLISNLMIFLRTAVRFRGGDRKGRGDCKLRSKNTSSSDPIIFLGTAMRRGEDGFSLIEISLALLLIGMLISAVLKSAPLIEAVQLRAVVKNVDSYRMATQLFVEKYGHLPGDYPKASQTLGPHAQNGNGNGRVEGAGLDPHGEAFWFWQHLSSAGLIPHPGTLMPGEIPAFGHGLPKAKIGGGFTVVENPPSVPAMPGLWILLGEQNGVLNNRASLTPSQARQILDLCGEADPLHGSLRVMEGMDAPPQSCLHHGHINLQEKAATCIMYFRV